MTNQRLPVGDDLLAISDARPASVRRREAVSRHRQVLAGTVRTIPARKPTIEAKIQVAARRKMTRRLTVATRCGALPSCRSAVRSDLGLLGYFQGVIDLNTQTTHRRLQLRVAEQQLNSPQVFGVSIDQGRFSSPH